MSSVKNSDIAGLLSRILRFKKELIDSQSSGLASLQNHDKDRLTMYLDALKAYKAWVVGLPVLDLPKTHPRPIMIKDNPEVTVENEAVSDILRMLDALYTELAGSQSADLSSSMIDAYDGKRFDNIIAKVEAFISDYIEVAHPLDLPESASAPDA